jgi:hypothetical protein
MFGILVVRTLRMEQHQLSDCAIIAVDAFTRTRMESAYAVTVQNPEMHGSPMYFTIDLEAGKRSLQMLARFEPEFAFFHWIPESFEHWEFAFLNILSHDLRSLLVV